MGKHPEQWCIAELAINKTLPNSLALSNVKCFLIRLKA